MKHRRGNAAFVVAATAALLIVPALPSWACEKAYFSPQSYVVTEAAGSVVLTVQNPGTLDRTRIVDYQTVIGTAKSGSDFAAESGTLSFSPSDTAKTIDIAILNDGVNEPVERFEVKLKPRAQSCITELGPNATVAIDDDDPAVKPSPPRESEATGDSSGALPGSASGGSSGSSSAGSGTAVDASGVGPIPSGTATATGITELGSPEPVATRTVLGAATIEDGGGLPGVALGGIIAGAITLGAGLAFVGRRMPANEPPP